jgi:hypothetical protein
MTPRQKLQAAIDRKRHREESADRNLVNSHKVYFSDQHAWMANWPATPGGSEVALIARGEIARESIEAETGLTIQRLLEISATERRKIGRMTSSEICRAAHTRVLSMSWPDRLRALKGYSHLYIQEMENYSKPISLKVAKKILAAEV